MQSIIKSVNGDEINLSKTGVFYNKENQKAADTALKLAEDLKKNDINAEILTTDLFSPEITFNNWSMSFNNFIGVKGIEVDS